MKLNRKAFTDFFHQRRLSFKYAFQGWYFVLRTQRNAWLHMAATVLVILAGLLLNLSKPDWISILLVIGMVWIAEILNTALEIIVDLASPEKHPLAKAWKDVGAAAVLIAAIIAIVVGLIVFIPRFTNPK